MDPHAATDASLSLAQALAASVEAQRSVLQRHFETGEKRLKPKAIHELRVALRRLLTALSLSQALGLAPAPKTARHLRQLLSRLSPARDAHVQLRLLDQLLPAHPGSALLVTELRRRRRVEARRASKRLRAFATSARAHEVSALLSSLQATAGDPTLVAAALLGQLAQHQLGVDRQTRGVSADDPVALHAARVALKEYRYALEALAPTLPGTHEPARRCEELQNLLGAAHDVYVLAQSARELAQRQGSSALAQLADALTERSHQAHLDAAAALARQPVPWLDAGPS